MFKNWLSVMTGGAALIGASAVLAQQPAPELYTGSQAIAGSEIYARHCAVCHGSDLANGSAPELKGPAFDLRTQKTTVAQLLTTIARTMPKGSPGSLSPEDGAAVTAYLLRENGFAAGGTPLMA